MSKSKDPLHPYKVVDGKIKYIDQDSLSEKIHYGYETVFSYFKEYDCGNIKKPHLDAAMGINIYCGYYSYADVPKPENYITVLGVTGTLESLH